MVRRRINFVGRVQGVGFRATARRVALGLPVTGWVRNDPDGSVTAEVQGTADALAAFLEGLRRAMTGHIRAIHESPMAVEPGESGFEIRR
ncbi:MAG: acylphosphatase [Phycisphaerae bacterium]|nr:MAG: acylphosphatase [Phycisphaerae bacterium]